MINESLRPKLIMRRRTEEAPRHDSVVAYSARTRVSQPQPLRHGSACGEAEGSAKERELGRTGGTDSPEGRPSCAPNRNGNRIWSAACACVQTAQPTRAIERRVGAHAAPVRAARMFVPHWPGADHGRSTPHTPPSHVLPARAARLCTAH